MKTKLVFLLIILQVFSVSAQNDLFNAADINISGKQLLIVGEMHYVQEFYDIQYNIIEHIVLQNTNINNFQLLIEYSPCLNYYLDRLTLENDSVSLKIFLSHNSRQPKDTLIPAYQALYDFIMKIHYLSKSLKEKTFRFNCYDNAARLRSLVLTVLDILKKYAVTDTSFLEQITYLDSFQQKKHLDHLFLEFHQNFGNYFTNNREMLKNILTETDFYHLSEIMRRSPPYALGIHERLTQERENMMFEQINNSYNDSAFFFCIIGAEHISKPFNKSYHY